MSNSAVSLQEINHSNENLIKIDILPDNLHTYYCSNNKITKIENLPNSLHTIDLDNNDITKIENLPNNLKRLHISSNPIAKIENLPNGLRRFDCRFGQIIKMEDLPDSLKILCLNYNKIKKIENLPSSLKELYCVSNETTKIENLPTSLEKLDIRYNCIIQKFPSTKYKEFSLLSITASKILSLKIEYKNKISLDLEQYLEQPKKKCFRCNIRNFIYKKKTKFAPNWYPDLPVTYIYCYPCSTNSCKNKI